METIIAVLVALARSIKSLTADLDAKKLELLGAGFAESAKFKDSEGSATIVYTAPKAGEPERTETVHTAKTERILALRPEIRDRILGLSEWSVIPSEIFAILSADDKKALNGGLRTEDKPIPAVKPRAAVIAVRLA